MSEEFNVTRQNKNKYGPYRTIFVIECLLYISPSVDYNLTLLSPVLNVSWKAPDNIWGHAVFVTVRMLILLDVFANPELKATS